MLPRLVSRAWQFGFKANAPPHCLYFLPGLGGSSYPGSQLEPGQTSLTEHKTPGVR